MLTNSNSAAFAVLAILIYKTKNGKIEFDTVGRQFHPEAMLIEAYVNGREQGFSVHYGQHKVSFAEYRNSDNIAVYSGEAYKFSMQGNTPNENIYANSTHFSEGEYEKVAIHCLKELRLIK